MTHLLTRLGLPLALTAMSTSGFAADHAVQGESVRIALGGKREAGVGIRGNDSGWQVRVAADATSVALIDQTDVTHDKWVLPVASRALRLDRARFQDGHAYRYELHRGAAVIERGLLYLYPTRMARVGRVRFEAKNSASTEHVDSSGEIPVQPKSAL
jgi:hypothetical protein